LPSRGGTLKPPFAGNGWRLAYRLFIFDFDGTLADSGPMMFEILNRAALRYDFRPVIESELPRFRESETRTVMRELGIKRWRLPQLARFFRRQAKAQASPPLFPGIVDVLRALNASGATLAVVSSNSEAVVRRALGPEHEALIHCYECSASMFGKAKKFKKVLKITRCDPADAIAIGDETRDIEASRKAGVACGAVSWGYAAPSLLAASAPDVMIETPAEIAALRAS
jgi:phosphoglycolate phosphatase